MAEKLKMSDYDGEDRPKLLAIDLDGTIFEYDGDFGHNQFGPAVKGIVEELQKISDAGWKIVLWTCREDTPEMREYLREQGIPYHYINDHPWNGEHGPRKIHADLYVDDKALSFTGVAGGLAAKVLQFKPWWAYDALGR
jgi:hypothetical protein